MRFRHLLLENLFSYRHAEFDFTGETAERNIVLVFGRNGYGKTSLTNAIKLLFAGPNEDIRASVFPDSGRAPLKPAQYVLGVSDEWMGIFNAQARDEGAVKCRVRLEWDENGTRVEVERCWHLVENGYRESLEIEVRGEQPRHLEGDGAQQFLNERLPEDYLPFFFFDGEQIQRLAEANRSQTAREIERLLQLSPIDTLLEYMEKVAKEWRRADMPAQAKLQQTSLERQFAELQAKEAQIQETVNTLQQERDDLGYRIRQEEIYLNSRRAGRLRVEESSLKKELTQRQEELELLQRRIAESLSANAFLLANPNLVDRALGEIRCLLDNPGENQAAALREILDDLPDDLFKPPHPTPALTGNQVKFYRERLTRWLQTYITEPGSLSDSLFRLDAGRAQSLRSLLDHVSQSRQEKEDRISQLMDAACIKYRIRELEERLNDISSLSPEEQHEYNERKAANDERLIRKGAIGKELETLEDEARQTTKLILAKDAEVRSQERKVELSEKNRRRLEQIELLTRFFRAYRTTLKQRKRAAVEEAVNQRFRELVSSHNLIAHIRVDETFGVHYLDAQERPVGTASISAGMTQLAATAILWGLKEVSGKDVPLVIDTPLARIDRGHQENLLNRYYPHAGGQVIILPTDSEIDREKHTLIAGHVYKEYQLVNQGGQDTHLREALMYPAEVPHV